MRAQEWAAAALLAVVAAGAQGAGTTRKPASGPHAAAQGLERPAAPTGNQSHRRPMTFEDMMKMRRLGDIAVSPDGRWVLFAATDVDLARNTRTPHLWIVPAAGGKEIPVTDSMAGESHGRFSPDGQQILFLSSRGGSRQVWLADFHTEDGTIGEPHELTHISTEADSASWSPDGKHILLTSSVYPECSAAGQDGSAEDACNKQREEERAQSKVKARIFTHLLYRHWNSFTDDKRNHLFLASAQDGNFRDLNPGDEHDVPPFSLGEPDGWDFSPDGKEIAFEEKQVDDPALSTNVDIFTLRLFDDGGNPAAGAKPMKISTSAGGDFTPRYSADGKFIAWRMQQRAGYESDRFRLVVYDRSTKKIREVLPEFDRWVDEETWAPDSKTIYFAAGEHGEEPIYSVEPDGSKLSRLTWSGEFGDLHVTADGKLLLASRMTVRQPAEVASLRLDQIPEAEPSRSKTRHGPGTAEGAVYHEVPQNRVSTLNDGLLSQLDLPRMEAFWFTSPGGVRVQGFIIRPPGFDAQQEYPVKFLIHGGPQGAWGDSWSYRWNPELFAASGYVVVMINPGGSTGYGQAFVDRVNGDWGGRPYADLMRGLDYAEQHYPFIEKSRECALGASYGGYMANWILGHSDRFRCLVSHDGMFNPISAYGTTDELWFNEWEFKGTPWTNRLLYRRWSPMLAETHFKTPTLVVHGQLDYRLDVSEGYQLFDTLQRMKVPSKMLYFPDEGHWVLKPQNSQLWYKTVNDWVDQWTHTNQQGTK
jgi:dipeptidyl aminopeptidase/acylaminoacyl peptidase